MRAVILMSLLLAAQPLAACSELGKIAGPPPEAVNGAPTPEPNYRDLADLPAKPAPASQAEQAMNVEALTEERARAAQEVDRLRREPVVAPDPNP